MADLREVCMRLRETQTWKGYLVQIKDDEIDRLLTVAEAAIEWADAGRHFARCRDAEFSKANARVASADYALRAAVEGEPLRESGR